MSTTTTTTCPPLHWDTTPTSLHALHPTPASPASQDASPTRLDEPQRPTVRLYNPATDREGIERVFRQVYTPLYRFAGLTTIAFIVFCRAYLDLSPQTCYVLVNDNNAKNNDSKGDNGDCSSTILGYIVGTPNTRAFCTSFAADQGCCKSDIEAVPAAPRVEEMRDPELRGRCMEYFRQRNAWVSAIGSGIEGIEGIAFSGAKTALEERYPAHFHMALAPEAQGRGFGGRLVGAFEEGMRGLGVRGVYAAVPVGNEAAGKLYGKCGFGGLKREDGEEVGVLGGGEGEMEGKELMVKTLV